MPIEEKNGKLTMRRPAHPFVAGKTSKILRYEAALQKLIDWDGDTWRITSKHPNDKPWQDEWKEDIAAARALLIEE